MLGTRGKRRVMKREQLNATVPCALVATMASFIQRAEEVGITA